MNLKRHIEDLLLTHHKERDEALILLGARQVGKTTLLKRLFHDAHYFLLDNEAQRFLFERYDISYYKSAISKLGQNMLVIDEIQLLSDPGRAIKILYDQVPGIKIVATGSSTLNIKNNKYTLFPLTFSEMLMQKGIIDVLDYKILENIKSTKILLPKAYIFDIFGIVREVLTFGSYPHLVQNPGDIEYLRNIANDVIYKDMLELNLIENRSDASRLLKLLAYQIGNIVNYSQIASSLSIDVRRVQRYIEIFEKSFLLFRLYPYSSNKKTELKKSPKIYFHDLGIRNAIINNFENLDVRNDKGAIFENFIICEVIKSNEYTQSGYKLYYWRTKSGSEVDLVLEKNDQLVACEIKFSGGRTSNAFQNRYPNAKLYVAALENFY